MPQEKPLEQWTDQELANFVGLRFDDSKTARLIWERQWVENFAFFIGQQFSIATITKERTVSLIEPAAPSWRVRLVVNKILPAIRILSSKITKITPKITILPNVTDDKGRSAAKIGTKLIQHFSKKLRFTILRYEAVIMMLIFGTSFLKTFFNPKLGDTKEIEIEDGETKEKVKKRIILGEQEAVSVSPFEIFPQPSATEMGDMNWFIHATFKTVEEIFEQYGVIVEAERGVQVTPLHQQLNVLMGKTITQSFSNGVILKEYWQKPSAMNPKGLLITIANNKVLQKMRLPKGTLNEMTGEVLFPIEPFYYIKIPNSFWAYSIVPQAIPLQKEYNRARSQVIEYKNLMVKGKYLIPFGCRVSVNAFTTEPGEKIFYNSTAGRPEILQFVPLPNFIFTNIAALATEINDLFGIHEVSQAKPPGSIRSGVAIQFLGEQDDTQLGTVLTAYEESLKSFSRKILFSVRENYNENRTINIVGAGQEVDVLNFKGDDLPEDPLIDVGFGAGLPLSKVARQQFFLQLWRDGIVKDPNKMLKLLDAGVLDDVFGDQALDEADARLESVLMMKGERDAVEDFDNHDIHIIVHNNFRKSPEFRKANEKTRKLFVEHLQAHKDKRDQDLIEQQELLAGLQPAPPGGGAPGGVPRTVNGVNGGRGLTRPEVLPVGT